MDAEIPELHETLARQLGCDIADLQVLNGSTEGDLHDKCHREPQFHISEAQPAEERVPRQHGASESIVPGDL